MPRLQPLDSVASGRALSLNKLTSTSLCVRLWAHISEGSHSTQDTMSPVTTSHYGCNKFTTNWMTKNKTLYQTIPEDRSLKSGVISAVSFLEALWENLSFFSLWCCLHSLSPVPLPVSLQTVVSSLLLLIRTASLLEVPLRLYREQPENPEGPCHLSVLKVIISSKSHMPCEVTSPHALGVRVRTDLGGHYSVYHSYTLPSQNRCIEYFKFWSIRLSSGVVPVRDDGIPCSVGQDWYWGAWAGRPLHHSWKSQGSPPKSGQSCSQSSGFQVAALSPVGSLQHSTSVWLIDLHYISEHRCGLPRGQRKGQRLSYCTDRVDGDKEAV